MASKNKWFKSVFSEELLTTTCDQPAQKKRKKYSFNADSNIEDSIFFSMNNIDTETHEKSINNICTEPINFKSSNWIENFAPQNRSELALHNKKIKELDDWFNSIKSNAKNCPSPILLITGPSGSGKTASLKILSKEFNYSISEWITPIDIENTKGSINDKILYNESQADKFLEFLMHSSRYPSLFETQHKRLVLVEDFPNVFLKDNESFVNILEHYKIYGKSPLIFIVTDSKSRTLNINNSVFTNGLRERFEILTINFNSVADTFVQKGLKRITGIMKQTGFQNYYKEPSSDVIDSIVLSSQGDLRNAVINLHFASQKNSYNLTTSIPIQKSGRKKSKKSQSSKLKSLGCDETLSVMHALGRIFNPKFSHKPDSKTIKSFTHSPEIISSILMIQPSTNLNLIHANCGCHFNEIDDLARAANILSEADVMLNEWRSEALSDIAIDISVRGVMVSNENPVTSKWLPIRSAKPLANIQIDYKKEFENIELNSLTTSNILALDYKSYVNIIESTSNNKEKN